MISVKKIKLEYMRITAFGHSIQKKNLLDKIQVK